MQTPTTDPPLPCYAKSETMLPLFRCFSNDQNGTLRHPLLFFSCFLVSGRRARPCLFFFFCRQWISHCFLRGLPWSHPPTLHYRWSKRLCLFAHVTAAVSRLWVFCELRQRRVSMKRLCSELSSSGQTSFLQPCVWTEKKLMSCGEI